MLKFKVTGEITVSPLATSENEFKEGLEKVINEWLRGNVCNYQGGVSVELVDEKNDWKSYQIKILKTPTH